jgi:hypothetical protein
MTLSNIHRDKQLQINSAIVQELKSHLNNTIYNVIYGSSVQQPNKPKTDKEIEQSILQTQEGIERNFISDYEIAGQNIVD